MLLGLKGTTREYLYSLPVTITVVLGLSWVMAMTFCVLLAHWFIVAPADPDESLSPVVRLCADAFRRKPKSRRARKQGRRLRTTAVARRCAPSSGRCWPAPSRCCSGSLTLPVGSEFFPEDIRDQFTDRRLAARKARSIEQD